MMFARIFKKFNFYPHPVSFDMKMYIDGDFKKLPEPPQAYQELVTIFENKTKGDIDEIKTLKKYVNKHSNITQE